MRKKIAIIGSGFSGIAAASVLAKSGHDVTVFEKNDQVGGRARVFREKGYLFDMGPSWYWMPDVFERYFAMFGKKPSDYYHLIQLDPGFSMFFGKDDVMDIPVPMEKIYDLFDKEENGGAEKLKRFLKEAELKYEISFKSHVFNALSFQNGLYPEKISVSLIISSVFKTLDKFGRAKYMKNSDMSSLYDE